MIPSTLNFGEVDTVLLLGGGTVLSRLAVVLRDRSFRVAVFTGPRLAHAPLPDEAQTLEEFLTTAGIPCVPCERIVDETAVAGYESPRTLAISLGAPWIFTKEFIDRFESRLLNVHGAPLPEHRGAGGFTWRILMEDRRGASLIHLVDRGVDTGPLIKVTPFEFPGDCRIPVDFERHQHQRDLEFLLEFVDEVTSGATFNLIAQDNKASTYFPRLYASKHGAIDCSCAASQLDRFIRAFDAPYDGAFTQLDDVRVVVRNALLLADEGPFHPFQAGLVYRVHEETACVAASGGGAVAVGCIHDQQGRSMIADRIVGKRLRTPMSWLEDAKRFRAVYLATGLKT